MIKTFTFGKTYFNKSNNNPFPGNTSSTNYSKILDDIILADIIKKNSYLFTKPKTDDDYLSDIILNAKTKNSKLATATTFLANYSKNKKKFNLPYKLNTTYTLSDGTPIIFYDDEIQIGFDYYKYTDFNDILLLKSLTPKKKSIIINIFGAGNANIDIDINL